MAPTPSRQKMKGKGKGSRSDSKAAATSHAVKKERTTHSGDGKRTKQSKPTRKSPRAKATTKNNVPSKSAHGKPRHVQQSSDVDEELECVSLHASQVDQRSCSSVEKKPVPKKTQDARERLRYRTILPVVLPLHPHLQVVTTLLHLILHRHHLGLSTTHINV
jgi:hypothetical protein